MLLIEPRSGVAVGLHHHEAHSDQAFDERHTGLDHISFGVAQRADLAAVRLDQLGVARSGVRDVEKPVPFSTIVFRDPDNTRLEFIHMPSWPAGGPARCPESVSGSG